MIVCAEGSYPVLVLLRAWAIWGTRKRVINILIWSYMIYVVVLMGGLMYGENFSKLPRLFCIFYSLKYL